MSVKKMRKHRQGTPIARANAYKNSAKLPGTRAGTLEDWRVAGKVSTDSPAARRTRLRDGR